jgi:hypothetical protein
MGQRGAHSRIASSKPFRAGALHRRGVWCAGIEGKIDMPKQKDLKRIVRTRMQKTGESYTAARAQLTRKPTAPKPSPAPDHALLAGMTDDAVRAKTGKTWSQWVKALDAIDAYTLPHREIAAHVHATYELTAWWSQTVTVGYERIRGLRAIGQRLSGDFGIYKSRTFPVPVETLHRAFADARVRAKWLGGVAVRVQKSTPPKSVRLTWPDGTRVETWFTDKGVKSQVAVQHCKLKSKDEADRLKGWWSERLDALGKVLAK